LSFIIKYEENAESEIINYIGEGRKREDIAAGVVDSVAQKVSALAQKKNLNECVYLTGGLSNNEYFMEVISKKLGKRVESSPLGIYAGAFGASILAKEKSEKEKRR
jgi:activator of 2-hydroxyglutaryl-CoA dehydratase